MLAIPELGCFQLGPRKNETLQIGVRAQLLYSHGVTHSTFLGSWDKLVIAFWCPDCTGKPQQTSGGVGVKFWKEIQCSCHGVGARVDLQLDAHGLGATVHPAP